MRPGRPALVGIAVTMLVATAGCGSKSSNPDLPPAPDTMRLASPAFVDGGTMPKRFTCSGAGQEPPLRWRGVPRGTQELALVMTDPDAPGGGFVHWTAYALSPHARTAVAPLPADALEGTNDFGARGYGPPCPPHGDDPHHYVFRLYALGKASGLEAGASPDAVAKAIERAGPLAQATLTGRFGRD
jgi:Raf kinase inhibitor-like YbhB/YbcL family protein